MYTIQRHENNVAYYIILGGKETMDIERILQRGETQSIEFKKSLQIDPLYGNYIFKTSKFFQNFIIDNGTCCQKNDIMAFLPFFADSHSAPIRRVRSSVAGYRPNRIVCLVVGKSTK